MSTTTARLTANQTNARKSTGPRTEAGKQRASLNALRHGITSQIVVFPGEDMAAFRAFGQGFFNDLQPEGAIENQFVQTLADTQWRLNRLRAHETNLFALGHEENAGSIDTDDQNIQTALAGAATLRANTDALKTLSIYEQRLNRLYLSTLKELRETQTIRKDRQRNEMREALLVRKQFKIEGKPFDPAEFGFVLTNAQIETYKYRKDTIAHARNEQERREAAAATPDWAK